LANLLGHSDWITGLAFSPDDSLLASGSDDGTVIVWDVSNRKPLATFQDKIIKADKRVQFTADNRLLFSWNPGNDLTSLKRWDLTTKTDWPLPFPAKDLDNATALAISSDGKLLAVGFISNSGTAGL
jgi:WD40 repeat protein